MDRLDWPELKGICEQRPESKLKQTRLQFPSVGFQHLSQWERRTLKKEHTVDAMPNMNSIPVV